MTKISLNIQNGYRKELESFCQECGLHYKAEHERKMDVQGDDEKSPRTFEAVRLPHQY